MQLVLSLRKTQTVRNILAVRRKSRETEFKDGNLPAGPLVPPAHSAITHTTMSKSLVSELEQLAVALQTDGAPNAEISLSAVGEKIAKSLGVRNDEVAILGISAKWRHLHFLVPPALKNVGFIPLSSNSALAARTARESRPEINNNFSNVRHASVFEGVKTPSGGGEAIHKIISAPILCDGKVVGVIQISRKGPSASLSGPDFSADELGKVLALCRPLGKLVRHVSSE